MTTREQRIEAIAESYEPAPAPRYSDRELSRQLAVAQTALERVQIERNRLQDENERLKAALKDISRTCNEGSPFEGCEPLTIGEWNTERIRRVTSTVRPALKVAA